MYQDTTDVFFTPRGLAARMTYRQDTNDYNTLYSCLNTDEYALPRDLRGVALDIGAYIGGVTVALGLENPDLRIVAVEPVPDNVRLLRVNVAINGLADRVTVIEGAVGSGATTSIRWGFRGNENALHHAFVGNIGTVNQPVVDHKETIVPTVTIAHLVPTGRIVWAKIDCEGGEWDFVRDPDLSRIDLLVGEWHPIRGRTRGQFTDLLGGFAVEYSGPKDGPGGFRMWPAA